MRTFKEGERVRILPFGITGVVKNRDGAYVNVLLDPIEGVSPTAQDIWQAYDVELMEAD